LLVVAHQFFQCLIILLVELTGFNCKQQQQTTTTLVKTAENLDLGFDWDFEF